ncbi:flagellar M-ring protein FliF [Paenibacillus hemerocallicola]|uniref:Flagellar M-ring protein n=1 Tax=Paenibacillus hemerocallicola TaxID=1172614 RepID=A0A5C4T5F0_9BACL|nr:flagellar basal-body MS-ring/collar protein FliF [Paenibacillus hemerocallicola]TNJ64291.1 flagellar M-ring protein FliF [Paenibacillus hemerocallicola]
MNETLVQYRDKATLYWKQLSKNQKYMVIGTVVILLAVVILTSINLSKTEFATAFRNLQPNDAANIKKYLDDSKIPYQLTPDGTSIAVPASEAASIKLEVESQGLNKNGSLGYGAFEGSNTFGMSDNEFNVKLINAMQGEIQQMFNQINGVASSKVLITVPKETAFVTTQPQESTASVILNIESGYRFDQAQIDTMYNLVAKTIPKLKYENITISNQNGELLPYSKTNGAIAGTSGQIQQQFQVKNQFQNELQKNIMSLLGKMYAPDKVVVSVISTLNFDQKTSKQNLVTPVNTVDNRGIEISLQENSKSATSTGGATGGVPGTGNTDVPTYQGGQNGGGQSESEENNRIVNFEVNRITNEIVSSPFIVKDLSISVGIEPPVKDDPNSLTQEMKDNIQKTLVSIVSATLADSGQAFTEADIARKVTLFAQPFAVTPGMEQAGINYWMWGGIGVAAMVLAGVGGFMIRRRRQRQLELVEEELSPPTKVELPTIDIENVSNESQVRKQLEGLAKRKPDEFVNLLRTWLVDE